jgi:phage-related protein
MSESDVAITISAIDQASDVISGVQGSLQDMQSTAGDMSASMAGMTSSVDASGTALNDMSGSLDGTTQSFAGTMRGMMGLSGVLRMGIMDFEHYHMLHIRMEAATVAVEKAQTAYNKAVAKYGENSTQALIAAQTLQVAQDRLNYYQERSTLNMVNMGLQIPTMISGVMSMAGSFGALSGVFGSATTAIGGVVAALGPIGIAIIAIIAVVALLYTAWTQDWGGIREIVGGSVKTIQGALGGFLDWMKGLASGISNALGGVGYWLQANWKDMLMVGLTGPLGLAMEAWKNNWFGIRDIVTNALSGVQSEITTGLAGIASWVTGALKPISDVFSTLSNDLSRGFLDLFNMGGQVATMFMRGVQNLQLMWKNAWDPMGQGLSGFPNFIKMVQDSFLGGGGFVQAIQTTFSQLPGMITPALSSFGSALSNAFKDVFSGLGGVGKGLAGLFDLSGLQSSISDSFSKVADTVRSQSPLLSAAFTTVKDVVSGNWGKVWIDLGTVTTQIADAFGKAADAVRAQNPLLAAAFSTVKDVLQGNWNKVWSDLGTVVTTAFSQLSSVVSSGIAPIQTALQSGWNTLVTTTSQVWGQIKGTVDSQFPLLGAAIQTGMDLLKGNWGKAWQDLQGIPAAMLGQVQTSIVSPLAAVGKAIADSLAGAVNSAQRTFAGIVNAIATPLNTVASQISDKFPAMATAIQGGTEILTGNWVGGMQKLADAVPGIFGTIGSVIQTALSKVGDVIGTGMTGALQAAHKAFDDFVNSLSAKDPFKAVMNLFTNSLSGMDAVGSHALQGTQTAVTNASSTITSTLSSGTQNWMAPIQGFVNWLIGGSIWPETWDKSVQVLQKFGPQASTILTTTMTQIQSVVQSGLTKLQSIFSQGIATLEAQVRSGAIVLNTLFQPVVQVLNDADVAWQQFYGDLMSEIPQLREMLGKFVRWFTETWTTGMMLVWDKTIDSMAGIRQVMGQMTTEMKEKWSETLGNMIATTTTGFNQIVAEISAAVDAIVARLNAAWQQISKHSIWPDMLNEMLGQTKTTMGQIQGVFHEGLGGSSGIVPLLQGIRPSPNVAVASPNQSQTINIPVSVYLDGQQISTLMEQRLVKTLYRNANRSRRSNVTNLSL